MFPDFPPPRAPAPALPIPGLSLRAAATRDLRFVHQLQSALRTVEFAALPLPEEQKRAFFDRQIQMQHLHYLSHFPDADFWIVEHRRRAIGVLYLDRSTPEWRVIDVILSPDVRGRGWGSALIAWVQDQAAATGAGVALSVAFNNPRAHALYRRLAFAETTPGAYSPSIAMAWRPIRP